MKLVILESPYAAGKGIRGLVGRWQNRRYARKCLRDSLARGEAPIASHLLYTQPGVLRDGDPGERKWGIEAGLAWAKVSQGSVVYIDRGISSGIRMGIAAAQKAGKPVTFREFGGRATAVDVDPGNLWPYLGGVVVAARPLDATGQPTDGGSLSGLTAALMQGRDC